MKEIGKTIEERGEERTERGKREEREEREDRGEGERKDNRG